MKVTRKILASALAALVVVLLVTQLGFAAQRTSDKVFWMAVVEVPIAKLPQFHTLAAETIMPWFEDHGCHWVASWQTIVDDVEGVVYVAEFENIGAYHQARVSLRNSPEWEEFSRALRPLIRSSTSRLLTATHYSPLQ